MQNGNEAKLTLETPLRILGKALQCLFDCRKEDIEHLPLIAQDDRVKIMRKSEDQMEVSARQQFGSTVVEPTFLNQGLAFGTMPVPTGVVGYPLEGTLVTLLSMAT